MEKQTSLYQYLTKIQQSLNIESHLDLKQNYQKRIQERTGESHDCKNNLLRYIQRNIYSNKLKVIETIKKVKLEITDKPIGTTQRNLLNTLKKKLQKCNRDVNFLLKQGILTIYMDLCDITNRTTKLKIEETIPNLLKSIIIIIINLLKVFLAYQQYHNHKNMRICPMKNVLFINKQSENLKEQTKERDEQDLTLFKCIQLSMIHKPVSELLHLYMKEEVKEMNNKLQVCRICSNRIKLDNMQNHVILCQQKCFIMQQISEKILNINDLFQDLREQYQILCERKEKTEHQQLLRNLIALLLFSQKKKQKYLIRRSSVDSQKNLKEKVQHYIEDFQEQNGEHYILHKLLLESRQKTLLQRKMNALQIAQSNLRVNEIQQFAEDKQNALDELQIKLQCEKFKLRRAASLGSNRVDFIAKQEVNSNSQKDIICLSPSSNQFQQTFSKKSLKKEKTEKNEKFCRSCVSLQQIEGDDLQSIPISLKNFQILKLLGQGSFGMVYLGRRIQTGDIYALKVIKIHESYEKKDLDCIKNEHQIFKKIAGDHLVKAPFSFSEKASQIFVLQYLPGGDLRKLLNEQVYLQQEKAKFYIAQIVLAIEHLHNSQIIHRDLKPQNLVIDRSGHLKLTDFGLSEFKLKVKFGRQKILAQKSHKIKRRQTRRSAKVWGLNGSIRLIGTPDYIAPQIISQLSIHNESIDWWSLGVITYEMLIGVCPFTADTVQQVLRNIMDYRIQWPEVGSGSEMISPVAKDFISKLLNPDYTNRLGAKGVNEIKLHPFFKGIDWDQLKRLDPPIIPKTDFIESHKYLQQDKKLKKQIEQSISRPSNLKTSNKLQLKRFVRFDVLGDETIENVEKIYEQESSKIQLLRSVKNLSIKLINESESIPICSQ